MSIARGRKKLIIDGKNIEYVSFPTSYKAGFDNDQNPKTFLM